MGGISMGKKLDRVIVDTFEHIIFPDAYAIEPMWGALGSLPYVGCTRNKLDKLKDTSKILNPCNPSSDIVSMVVELQT